MKKLNILILAIVFLSTHIKSQISVIEDIINVPLGNVSAFLLANPVDDAKILIEGYVEPFGKSIGTGLNSGWYNTGKSHRFPGFDLTFGGHVISLPNESKTFSAVLSSGLEEEIPTINGDAGAPGFASGGGDWRTFYMPYIQGSIGLIYKTEVLFRYMPPISYSNINANYWGFGIKHDFKQYVPIVGKLPFDLSFLAAYSNFQSDYQYNDQVNARSLDFDVQAFNCNIILSKKLAFITAYAGAGYQHSASNLAFNGTWTLSSPYGMETQEDPLNLSLGGVDGFKTNIGARIKFLLFTLHADYTVAEYNMFTIGIGLNSNIGSRIIGGSIEKATKKDKKKDEKKD